MEEGQEAADKKRQTIVVIDDEQPVCRLLERLLGEVGYHVVSTTDPSIAVEIVARTRPDLVLCDLTMPGLNGLELQQALIARGHEPAIIFLTGHGDIPMSVKAMKQGAVDFLTKPVDDDDLLKAVRNAIEKDRVRRQARAEVAEIQQRLDTLTPREREVLQHVISGHLNKQTAADLGTVEKTIKVHRARVMEKMKVSSVAELVRLAERAGFAAQ